MRASELSQEILIIMDAFDDMSGISLQIHEDFRPVYMSQNMLQYYGFHSADDYYSLDSILTLIPPELHEQAKQRYQMVMTDGKTEPLILENLGSDGQRFTVKVQDKRIMVQGRPMALTVIQDITEQVEHTRALTQLAMMDELTGITNRRSFYQRAEAVLVAHPVDTAILLLDLDNFKAINDQHGHEAGDRVLKNFALICQRCIRHSDLFARIGGDEFVICAPAISAQHAQTLANKLLVELRQAPVFETSTQKVYALTSIGITLSQKGQTLEQLMRHADKAMYQAKNLGRNASVLHEL